MFFFTIAFRQTHLKTNKTEPTFILQIIQAAWRPIKKILKTLKTRPSDDLSYCGAPNLYAVNIPYLLE